MVWIPSVIKSIIQQILYEWMQNHPKNAMNTAVPHSLAKIFTIVFCFCSILFFQIQSDSDNIALLQ